ncbi:Flagellar biosynthetic protein FliP precursor [Poriferisphaera corsica]|uniref:Flagellar biosynthetic protein FliP n=1 Tax=Poriferisphaera corsica TaxID=2528020 RepID=A0A517YSQ7_9BACT|nr:flagellar type III secretion system pore protein FliP [Poriferisphaera corsica]QDU33182.1 Flagellar biosynthetic protein FliP precursor [Poriferisphaera corsica]
MIRITHILLIITAIFLPSLTLTAQSTATNADEPNTNIQLDLTNPVSILKGAEDAIAAMRSDGNTQFDRSQGLSSTLSVIILLTILSLAPALLVLCTSFTRIIIVLALLRQAIGTQSLPPSQVIIGLALFMSFLIMYPTFQRINDTAIVPLNAGTIDEFSAWENAKEPLREFMFDQISYAGNWENIYMILNYRGVDTSEPETLTDDDVDMLTLIPAFILSELKVAFLMGFRLYLPFLVIDMVVSSILISMGMMMLPPIMISLPFKLLMFVLVDGWMLVAGNLLNSFSIPGVT